MGWLIGISVFLASWLICFVFTYKVYYYDMKKRHDNWSDKIRKEGLFFASLHLIGVFIAIAVLLSILPDIINNKVVNEKGFIGKFLRKLEK